MTFCSGQDVVKLYISVVRLDNQKIFCNLGTWTKLFEILFFLTLIKLKKSINKRF